MLSVVVALVLVVPALPRLSNVGVGPAGLESGQAEVAAPTWRAAGIRALPA